MACSPGHSEGSLASRLENIGLDVARWVQVFKETLEIDKVIQIKHLGDDEFEKLRSHTHQKWEYKALCSLRRESLKENDPLKEDNSDQYSQQSETLQQNNDSALDNVSTSVKPMSNVGLDKIDQRPCKTILPTGGAGEVSPVQASITTAKGLPLHSSHKSRNMSPSKVKCQKGNPLGLAVHPNQENNPIVSSKVVLPQKPRSVQTVNSQTDAAGKSTFKRNMKSVKKNSPSQPSLGSKEYNEILVKLGLWSYAPVSDQHPVNQSNSRTKTISIQDVMAHGTPSMLDNAAVDLPWKLLQKLIMGSSSARDVIFLEPTKSESATEMDEWFGSEAGKDESGVLNPMDVLLVTFGCCDRFLQQVLAQKLFECKLAIPYIYPHTSPENLVMSLWALRTIILEWRENEKAVETSVTNRTVRTVTFVKLRDNGLSVSKSKLMNDVLRDEGHDSFFHRDCPNGTASRKVAGGMVECSWFLPAGKVADIFPDATLFLNLRGGGSSFPRQMEVLNHISSTMVVIADPEDFESKDHRTTFRGICSRSERVVLILTRKANREWLRDIVGEEHTSRLKVIFSFKKNATDLKTEVRIELSKRGNPSRNSKKKKVPTATLR